MVQKFVLRMNKMHETNITTFTIKHNKILRATVVTSYMTLLNLLLNPICVEFEVLLKW
jgi:hypothetical protein